MFIQIDNVLINTNNITYITEIKTDEVTVSRMFMCDGSNITFEKPLTEIKLLLNNPNNILID